jgi:cytochrome P450
MTAAAAEFLAYMRGHVEAKRTAPGDDLLSDLIASAEMDDTVLVYTGQGLLLAGHETTANMIGKMVALLLAKRDRWQALVMEPSQVATAVEEALRFDAHPGIGMMRYPTEDLDVAVEGEGLPRPTDLGGQIERLG